MPTSTKLATDIDALGGFITGDATVSISGTGFFASTRATVGFPAGAAVTNKVNTTIREITKCDWVPFKDVCPKVTGWSTTMQVVVSNKGAGAKGSIGSAPFKVSGTAWWSISKGWGVNVGIGDLKELDFLRRVQTKHGREVVAATKTDTFEVPKGSYFVALQLEGSTTGNVIVRDPKGVVIADTATATYAENVGFGRDPGGGPAAVLIIPGNVLIPGMWTVVRSGEPEFSKVTPLISKDEVAPEITTAVPVGGIMNRLTAGSSKLRISWAGPQGVSVALRATTKDGSYSLPIKGGLGSTGTYTWKVPSEWAGPLRLQAVTERDGIPVSTTTFATTFTVVRPVVPAPRGLRATRKAGGIVQTTWTSRRGSRTVRDRGSDRRRAQADPVRQREARHQAQPRRARHGQGECAWPLGARPARRLGAHLGRCGAEAEAAPEAQAEAEADTPLRSMRRHAPARVWPAWRRPLGSSA